LNLLSAARLCGANLLKQEHILNGWQVGYGLVASLKTSCHAVCEFLPLWMIVKKE
jgi:hypothetical protein